MNRRVSAVLAGLVLIAAIILASFLILNLEQAPGTTPTLTTTTTLTTPATETTTTQAKHYEDVYVSLVIEQLKCQPPKAPVYFRFTPFPNETITTVSVAGDFTGWTPHDMSMLDNGTWMALFCVTPGTVVYKYLINGAWVKDMSTGHYGLPVDPEAQGFVDDGFGGKNAVRQVSFPTDTRFFIHIDDDPVYLSLADEMLVARLFTSNIGDASVYVVAGEQQYRMKKQMWTDYTVVWYREMPFSETMQYFFIIDYGDHGLRIFKDPVNKYFNGNATSFFKQVSWVREAVGYQIFPDRFYNGDPSNDLRGNETDELWLNELAGGLKPVFSNWSDPITSLHCCHQYFGGDLAGVLAKLDYLDSLGVKMIYFNPIFLSGSVHGYDTYDYFIIDPKYGNETVLRALLDEAHRRGIKVIFDFVPNHVGIGFWAFQDVYRNGPQSPYWNWFIIKKWPFKLGDGSAYECWWGIGSLPKLNHSNPEVKQYLFSVALHWLEFGFDGLRIDVPLDVLDADNFYRELRILIKQRYPDAYIVAEIWTLSPEWLKGRHFDSLMNYALGRDILLQYAAGRKSGDQVFRELYSYYSQIPVSVAGMGFNIIGSHDTSRILTDLGGGRLGSTPTNESIRRLRLLVTLQFTVPGMPVIFQGDERGILGSSSYYDEHRYPIQWDKIIPEVFDYYLRMSWIKRNIPALKTSIISLYASNGPVIAFFRGYDNEVLVVANNNLDSTIFSLPTGKWVVLYPGEARIVEGELVVEGLTGMVLARYDYALSLGLIG
ncbi:pullulanase [Thermosphaera chiliense]|uniref:Pullulanase n=2 Tax=Thermosphaera chiliense TaxID=3402707 RepID=A0A7M1US69_9CREN|nr:pullulanase [Thermosphaera aggregans]